MRCKAIVAAVTLMGTIGLSAPSAVADPPGKALQAALDQATAAGIPGVIAEARNGTSAWDLASGVADIRTGAPIGANYEHRVGSITKTFVATTMLQLVAEGKVALDASIGTYIPDVVGGATAAQVTVRMLLNHTSGIGNYTNVLLGSWPSLLVAAKTTYSPLYLAEIGLGMPPTGSPGAAYSYSNTGYVLAALIVEHVTGDTIEHQVTTRILEPLGLSDTYFEGTNPTISGPHSEGYLPTPNTGKLRDFATYNMSWAWGVGDMVSTMSDLDTFYRALLQGQLLAPAEMTQMQTTVPWDPAHPEFGGYGLGIYSLFVCGELFWGHDGAVIGYQTTSYHSADGLRQVSAGANLYPAPDAANLALGRFNGLVVCRPSADAGDAGAAPSFTRPMTDSYPGVGPRR